MEFLAFAENEVKAIQIAEKLEKEINKNVRSVKDRHSRFYFFSLENGEEVEYNHALRFCMNQKMGWNKNYSIEKITEHVMRIWPGKSISVSGEEESVSVYSTNAWGDWTNREFFPNGKLIVTSSIKDQETIGSYEIV